MTDPEFLVPHGIASSVTLHELRLLQHYAAKARRVLEIGTHFGFSCIGMLLAGAEVTSIDPHGEGPHDQPDTWIPFLVNLERHGFPFTYRDDDYGHAKGVGWIALRARSEEYAHLEMPIYKSLFGMVFIDGNHVWPYPALDIDLARSWLCYPGYIAMHDVTPNWPGVWRAARELERSGWAVKREQVGTLAVYQKSDSSTPSTSITPSTAL